MMDGSLFPDIGDGKGTATVSRVIEDDKVYTHVSPEHLSFGCVACGFVYSLTVRITNKGPKPQAFKIRILPHADAPRDSSRVRVKFVPMKIAPGVKQEFQLELLASSAGAQSFDLLITQGINKLPLTFVVKALVVPLEVFKHVAKSLSLQKRPIYTNGVVPLGALGGADDSRSVVTGRASVLSEAIMDEADLAELREIPLVEGTYWDAARRRIVTDPALCAIEVNGEWSVAESIARTQASREQRAEQIEEEGNYTAATLLALDGARGEGEGEGGGARGGSPQSYSPNNSYLSGMHSRSYLQGDEEEERTHASRLATIQD